MTDDGSRRMHIDGFDDGRTYRDGDKSKFIEPHARFGEEDIRLHASAHNFMIDAGMTPTPDAVAQLLEAFVPCLRIMCERGYDPNGATWREGGWMSLVWEIRKKALRLWWRSWRNGVVDRDSAPDLINYAGMYMRAAGEIKPWGDQEPPYSGDRSEDSFPIGSNSAIREAQEYFREYADLIERRSERESTLDKAIRERGKNLQAGKHYPGRSGG